MSAICEPQRSCIVCGSDVTPLLDLDVQPPANLLLEKPGDAYEAFPLGFANCPSCTHGQLTYFVDPAKLFKHYLYASGTSGTLKAYFEWFSDTLRRACKPGARVLDIASNDGSLLGILESRGFEAIGVDPAENLNKVAIAAGRKVVTGFFPAARPEGLFDVIIAMNVAAHTPDPSTFMKGVRECLAPGGVAIIQTSQAMMIANGEFDTVYHEHYSFYTVASMARLAEKSGLRVEASRLTSVHGTSLLSFLRRVDEDAAPFAFEESAPFSVMWPSPTPPFLLPELTLAEADAAYAKFADGAKGAMQSAAEAVARHRASVRKIALVGVAAKALTFIRAAGIEPDVYLDEAALKVGLTIPGTSRPIEPLQNAGAMATDTTFLIGAWNFADELMRKIRNVSGSTTPKFIIYFPTLTEIG
ncbi:class I SAM-dependent methyltransferase [Hyphomicrobium sp. MC1]|uniref:class I SAM-dependent methyltransferase n=1 Tax=Hyphomicrobium sp. (strain MC1) TaxID=717785 RepID=UPI000213DD64|nr:class I SAM-dependent methyltransferase [Hyphomicrobium sp. MC1]CCB66376.1 putative 3-demethylubiquinone-9 3-O-methyltransferase [Hyphomicrobium sp. MC1]